MVVRKGELKLYIDELLEEVEEEICEIGSLDISSLMKGRKWVDLLIDINTIRSRTLKIGAEWCFNVASRRSTYAFGAQHNLVKQS
ncbi:hypothetical protein ISN44_As11g025730 [Arabidopsis suecica]|uniref:Uncharacterized protein n=1 Tax=Arabidopsis suecica TaxID=45249 RepID=A0A8T1ZBV8_ARASU|nr:hypothetical protein ISN44_As11g025730 [Arabidopsis suecica]